SRLRVNLAALLRQFAGLFFYSLFQRLFRREALFRRITSARLPLSSWNRNARTSRLPPAKFRHGVRERFQDWLRRWRDVRARHLVFVFLHARRLIASNEDRRLPFRAEAAQPLRTLALTENQMSGTLAA